MQTEPSPTSVSNPESEARPFQKLSKEELDQMTDHERSMYYFEKEISKLQEDIREAEEEIEILFDMSFAAQKGEMTEEARQQFMGRLSALKKFQPPHGNGSEQYVDTLMRKHNAGELPFGENINTLNEYIDGYKEGIEKVQRERQEYLDERFKVAR